MMYTYLTEITQFRGLSLTAFHSCFAIYREQRLLLYLGVPVNIKFNHLFYIQGDSPNMLTYPILSLNNNFI